jgi:hypothetical protein
MQDSPPAKGTKTKMAYVGMAMYKYKGPAIQGLRSTPARPAKEGDQPHQPLPHYFVPAIFLRTMRMLLSAQEDGAGNQDGTRMLRPPQ